MDMKTIRTPLNKTTHLVSHIMPRHSNENEILFLCANNSDGVETDIIHRFKHSEIADILEHVAKLSRTDGVIIPDVVLSRPEEAAQPEPMSDEDRAALELELNLAAVQEGAAGFYGSKKGPDGYYDGTLVVQITKAGNRVCIDKDGLRCADLLGSGSARSKVNNARTVLELVDRGDWVEVKKFCLNNGGTMFLWPDGQWRVVDVQKEIITHREYRRYRDSL